MIDRLIDLAFLAFVAFYVAFRVHQGQTWWAVALAVTIGAGTMSMILWLMQRRRARRHATR